MWIMSALIVVGVLHSSAWQEEINELLKLHQQREQAQQQELLLLQGLQVIQKEAQQHELLELEQLIPTQLSTEQKTLIQDTIDTFDSITSQTTQQLAHDLFETLLEPFMHSIIQHDMNIVWPLLPLEQLTTLQETHSLLNIILQVLTVLASKPTSALSQFILSPQFVADMQASQSVIPLLQNLQTFYTNTLQFVQNDPAQSRLVHQITDAIQVQLFTLQNKLSIPHLSAPMTEFIELQNLQAARQRAREQELALLEQLRLQRMSPRQES